MVSPRYASASLLIFWRMNADICWGVYSLPSAVTFSDEPIFLFTFLIVPLGFVTACLLAGSPTRSCPSCVNATYDGKDLPPTDVPSALGITAGLPPSITEAAELLVPRSIPIILDIFTHLLLIYLLFSLSSWSL